MVVFIKAGAFALFDHVAADQAPCVAGVALGLACGGHGVADFGFAVMQAGFIHEHVFAEVIHSEDGVIAFHGGVHVGLVAVVVHKVDLDAALVIADRNRQFDGDGAALRLDFVAVCIFQRNVKGFVVVVLNRAVADHEVGDCRVGFNDQHGALGDNARFSGHGHLGGRIFQLHRAYALAAKVAEAVAVGVIMDRQMRFERSDFSVGCNGVSRNDSRVAADIVDAGRTAGVAEIRAGEVCVFGPIDIRVFAGECGVVNKMPVMHRLSHMGVKRDDFFIGCNVVSRNDSRVAADVVDAHGSAVGAGFRAGEVRVFRPVDPWASAGRRGVINKRPGMFKLSAAKVADAVVVVVDAGVVDDRAAVVAAIIVVIVIVGKRFKAVVAAAVMVGVIVDRQASHRGKIVFIVLVGGSPVVEALFTQSYRFAIGAVLNDDHVATLWFGFIIDILLRAGSGGVVGFAGPIVIAANFTRHADKPSVCRSGIGRFGGYQFTMILIPALHIAVLGKFRRKCEFLAEFNTLIEIIIVFSLAHGIIQ